MTKDLSRRSSVAGSARVPSPRENHADEAQQSGEPSTHVSRSGSAMADTSNKEAPIGDYTVPAESQPMTASTSTSSNLPPTDPGTYGTRSRNRTGNPRPNYAEDRDLDMEFEIMATTSNGRKPARTFESGSQDNGRAVSATGKTSDTDQNVTMQGHHKEPIPGTLMFSANPTTPSGQASKKRKAANQSTANVNLQVQHQAFANGVPTAQAITRRASMAAHAAGGFRESNMLSFDNCGSRLKSKKLIADDGTALQVNDHVYLVCEPPGEPYYLGRIMEFLHANNDSRQPIDALRLNWYYRPKDIGRKVNDTRQVFASMHSDVSPLTALRGKCQIKHKSEVDNLEELRKTKHCFWYEKLYDRYIHRYYDVIPTIQVINVPLDVKKVLDERWKYIIVEPGRGKELTSAVKTCKRCSKYCASNDSVDCAVCKNTYHMSCVSPPLLKKPSRGFAWACGPCSKAQEKKLEARNTPNVNEMIIDGEDDEFIDEEDNLSGGLGDALETGQISPTHSNTAELSTKPGTAEQIHQASLWLFRYLGIHCKVEDALDYDDRIYPRASSRLGPRHQANITSWPGRPVEYVKPADIRKKYTKGGQKKDSKLSRETIAALEADKIARENRPKWVMDEPPGYVNRGEDFSNEAPKNTAKLLFRLPEVGEVSDLPGRGSSDDDDPSINDREQIVHNYMARAKQMAPLLGLPELSTNLLDVALDLFRANGYEADRALQALATVDRKAFKEPELTSAEQKKFEDGVAKFGSEWHSIKKHVKTVSAANIVRFYYTWKKTARGKHVWGNYTGRKGKKEAKKAEATAGKLQDDVADECDDSAFDNDKAFEKNRGFQCKFCDVRSSRQWRRAPNTPAGMMIMEHSGAKPSGKEKGNQLMVALCQRCAELWRHYAVQWEDVDEAAKKVAASGGRAWKRKIDEELLKELEAANLEESLYLAAHGPPVPVSSNGTPAPMPGNPTSSEPPRKKLKGALDSEVPDPAPDNAGQQKKKILVEKPYVPPPPPEPPKPKILPCAICDVIEPMGDQHLVCKDCRMTVHRNCYGVMGENRSPGKWVCDMCSNDKNPQVSVQYKCMLCPVEYTEQDFVEPPKTTHKKKNEKDRDRERTEREGALKIADYFRKKQEGANKPINPREPLKRTANNNWVHVTCAVFTPEVKFGNAKALEPSEGIPSIPSSRYNETCKACKQKGGACVNCHQCRAPVHVECARQGGYTLGFDVTPVKGSRRDHANIVTIKGESGTMAALVWCKEHPPTKTIVHPMHELVDGAELNALQLFVQNFKQADLTLTGTVRKANLVNQSTKISNPIVVAAPTNRRTSTTAASNRGSVSHVKVEEVSTGASSAVPGAAMEKSCITCGIDVSPRWWPLLPAPASPQPASPPPVAATADTPIPTNGDSTHLEGSPVANGQSMANPHLENGEGPVALAAAALHQDPSPNAPPPSPTEFQCHKCHLKKPVPKEPTPASTLPVQAPISISSPREPSRPPTAEPTPSNVAVPERDVVQPPPQYTWPTSSSYSSGTPYSGWPNQSPTPQTVSVHGLNGSLSPRIHNGASHQLPGQGPIRQPVQGIPHSPHQNGHVSQAPNGYPRPRSPQRRMSSSSLPMQNVPYGSYASTRPPPQHLTNGDPPPRAPEHPFHPNNHSRATFPPPHASPPMRHDSLRELVDHSNSQGRDLGNPQNNNARPRDGQVNGGASASPSLRNLLS